MRQDQFHSLVSARQTAAEVLAAAAVELYPDTLLFQGEGSTKVFFYDFLFPFAFQPEFLVQLEERMRQILKRDFPLKILNMVPGNAASLLEHAGQVVLAEKVKEEKRAMVQMVQFGGFADWCEASVLETGSPFYPFKLLEFYPINVAGEALIRIVGVLEQDKEILKKVVKASPSYAKSDHLCFVEKENFFLPMEDLGDGLWTWLPKAEALKQRFITWWYEEHRKQNFELMTTPACLHVSDEEEPGFYVLQSHRAYWQKTGARHSCKLAEISYLSSFRDKQLKNGLFESIGWIADLAHLFLTNEELFQECISSLQFITKIPKILGFEFQIVLRTGNVGSKKGGAYQLFREVLRQARWGYVAIQDPMLEKRSRIQVQIADALGRWWDGPFIEIDGSVDVRDGYTCLARSCWGSLERFVALCIEKYRGKWPFWLSPEQLRILVLSDESREYALTIERKLKEVGARLTTDSKSEPLKVRLHQALSLCVPFVVLIGDKEKEENCISYRTPESCHNEKMGVQEFINMIMELNGSKDSELEN